MATQLDLAKAQLLGWHEGKHGFSITSLVDGMGLTKSEWTKIKQTNSYLNSSEIEEIDAYFEKQNL